MLLQAEQMHKMVEVVILSVDQLITTIIFFSALDKSRVKWDKWKINTEIEDLNQPYCCVRNFGVFHNFLCTFTIFFLFLFRL